MPELPEVDAARRGIAEQLVGRELTGYELTRPGLIVAPPGLTLNLLVGSTLSAVERHGKYLLLRFEPAPISAVIHLKLAGQLVARGDGIQGFAAGHPVPAYDAPLPHKSTQLRLDFAGDVHLYLTDIRHFARVWLLPNDDVAGHLAGLRLGPDVAAPDFDLETLRTRLARHPVGRLKPTLLDQSVVAGLGNIYVDESLWQAKLHPERTVASLNEEELLRLYEGIRRTMAEALPLDGARILNGKALPESGSFPYVHGREGQRCPRCGATIIKTRVNNRGTYTCPRCQPAPATD